MRMCSMCINEDGICYMCGGAYPGAPDPDDAQTISAVYDRCWCATSSKDGHVDGKLAQSGMHPTAVSRPQTFGGGLTQSGMYPSAVSQPQSPAEDLVRFISMKMIPTVMMSPPRLVSRTGLAVLRR